MVQDPRLEENELKRVFGIQSTNGANVHLPPGFGRGLGLYPIFAFINHSCRSGKRSFDIFTCSLKTRSKAKYLIYNLITFRNIIFATPMLLLIFLMSLFYNYLRCNTESLESRTDHLLVVQAKFDIKVSIILFCKAFLFQIGSSVIVVQAC